MCIILGGNQPKWYVDGDAKRSVNAGVLDMRPKYSVGQEHDLPRISYFFSVIYGLAIREYSETATGLAWPNGDAGAVRGTLIQTPFLDDIAYFIDIVGVLGPDGRAGVVLPSETDMISEVGRPPCSFTSGGVGFEDGLDTTL